jgi:hypothetical protein
MKLVKKAEHGGDGAQILYNTPQEIKPLLFF